MRPITVMAPERLGGVLADVPTAKESGVDVEWITWRGFFVPGGISDERYRAWVDVLTAVGASPEWEAARKMNRYEPFFMVGADFDAFVKQQVRDFREMSREIGLIR
jgi:putative tricarboxylic transport membrane protein